MNDAGEVIGHIERQRDSLVKEQLRILECAGDDYGAGREVFERIKAPRGWSRVIKDSSLSPRLLQDIVHEARDQAREAIQKKAFTRGIILVMHGGGLRARKLPATHSPAS
jgi:hypothetical protein